MATSSIFHHFKMTEDEALKFLEAADHYEERKAKGVVYKPKFNG